MMFLLSQIPWRAWVIFGGVIAIGGAIGWLRHDAASDAIEAARVRALEYSIEMQRLKQERRDEIERLGRCELLRDALERLSGDTDAARDAFERCNQATTEDEAGDGGVPVAE